MGHHDLGGEFAVLTSSPWRTNLRRGADVEVTLRTARRPIRAELDEKPAAVAQVYASVIDRVGWQAAQRRLGITVPVGRAPTLDELEQAGRTSGLSLVRLTPR